MKRLLVLSGLVALAVVGSSCASLRSVSLTQVPAERSRPIEAEGFSWAIFGLYSSNDFVDEAIDGLQAKCPGGKVSGVYTKYEGRWYFLWTTRTIKAHAYCVAGTGGKKT